MRLDYLLRQVFRSVKRAPVLQLSAIGAMTAALVLCGAAGLGSFNVDQLTRHWGRGLHLVVYLQPDVPAERIGMLRDLLRRRQEIESVRLVSPQQAHQRLARSLGARSGLLDGVEHDFMPSSFEVRLRPGHDPDSSPLLGLLEALPGVDEVDFLGRWAGRMGTLAALIRGGSALVALLVALACLYIVASTIRLGVFARRDEIDIQRMLGATERFVRAPFLLEGALQGLISAVVAVVVLYGAYVWASPRLGAAFDALISRAPLQFLPPTQLWLGVLGGALLGGLGSHLALARHRQ